jgi:hypothetical protein
VSLRFELDDIEKQKAEEMGLTATEDDRYRILEMHIELDLAGHTSTKIRTVNHRGLRFHM